MERQKIKSMQNKQQLIMLMFLIFLTGCVVGWMYEMVFYRIDTGQFIKRGQGFGPWLPIYGFGALAITVLFYKKKESPWAVFLGSAAASGVIEFVTGWTLFHFGNGLRLWDYNIEIWNWGNIGGYVCLRSVLVFGIAGVFCIYLVIPKIHELTEKLRKDALPAMLLLGIVFMADVVFGYIIKPIMYWR